MASFDGPSSPIGPSPIEQARAAIDKEKEQYFLPMDEGEEMAYCCVERKKGNRTTSFHLHRARPAPTDRRSTATLRALRAARRTRRVGSWGGGNDLEMPWRRRIAAPPRLPRGYSAEPGRRRSAPRPRRG